MTAFGEFLYGSTGIREYEHESTQRGTFSFIHPTARIGARTIIFPGAYIGPDVELGSDCVVGPNAALGQPGYGYEWVAPDDGDDGRWEYKEHTFGVLTGDNVHVGANACIDGGRHRRTVIGTGSKIDGGVHIAHNVWLGRDCLVIANAMIAGSCEIEPEVIVNPSACIRDHTRVGFRAIIGMGAVVTKDVPAGEVWVGNPAKKLRDREEGEGADRRN